MRTPLCLLVALMLSRIDAASAQPSACAYWQQQYAAAVATSSQRQSPQRIKNEIAGLQQAAQQGRCNRLILFGPPRSPQCPAIMQRLNQLQGQLARGGGGPRQNPESIRRLLEENGCEAPRTQRSLQGGNATRSAAGRTLCVRLCDGYYFPIANRSSRDRIKTDAETCQSMHAAEGQAELFVEPRLGDVAASASADGKRYGDLEHAFRFQNAYIPACHAQLKAGMAALNARYRDAVNSLPAADQADAYPMPRLRPLALGEDPETVANRRGSFSPTEFNRVVSRGQPIRQVGAEYYADLYHPDAPPAELPRYRPPLGFDLLGSAMSSDLGFEDPKHAEAAAY